ncbi:Rieske (2Fe-2S) iron-sulfur domain protein [Anopheles sinensis]|uniref:Rieske (2Fe-2S) iron-sulfur domain protein n=1 Tax=Anopheles sinensis TaxID=74873 RepID=A0A084W034_ANOSI|nr:Rieske (2Fe-2S) iron-sulfur domain protein [Anopheles sinensis]
MPVSVAGSVAVSDHLAESELMLVVVLVSMEGSEPILESVLAYTAKCPYFQTILFK